MRKKLLFFATVAIAALASCSKTEIRPEVESRDVHFVVNTAENEVVKSFIQNNNDRTYTPKWSNGDELAIFIGETKSITKATGVLKNTNATGTTAKFDGKITGIPSKGTFKSFAPAAAFEKGYADGTVGINLASAQNPSRLTIDEACDILVAKEADYTADANGVVEVNGLYFKRMFSIVKIALNGPASLNGEKVQKFTLTAPTETVLAGCAGINLSTATIDKWTVSKNTITATYAESAPTFGDATSSGNVVWLVVNPVTIASGAKVVLAGETAGYTFSKEVTLPKALVFPQSQLAVINLTLDETNCTKKSAVVPVYASVAELIAAGTPTKDGTKVTVTLTDEEIIRFHTLKDGTVAGAIIKVGTKEVEIFCKGTPSDWKVGGTISGTLTNCDWKLYNSMWELCPADYSELTYKAPLPTCATPVITIAEGGVVSITCETTGATIHYTVGDSPADPTEADAVFSAVTLTGGQTIKAIAVAEGYKPSAVASKKYTVGGAEAVLVWDDDFSSNTKANTTALKSLNGSKTGFKDAYTTVENCYPEVSSIKLSSSKTIGSIQTPKFTRLSGTSSVTVTIEYAGYGTDKGTLNLSVVGNGKLSVQSLTATSTAKSGADVTTWDKATFVISGADKETALKLTASAKGKRFFINSIKIETN